MYKVVVDVAVVSMKSPQKKQIEQFKRGDSWKIHCRLRNRTSTFPRSARSLAESVWLKFVVPWIITTTQWYTFVTLITSKNNISLGNKFSLKPVHITCLHPLAPDISQIWANTQPPPNDTPVFRAYLTGNTSKYSEIWRAWTYGSSANSDFGN